MTSSDSPLILSGMKDNNTRLEAPVRGFLDRIVRQPAAHARFMNMLSMLEHMGSRKIMVSQMHKTLTEDILKHLAEEARHAYFFKRQAERMAKKSLDGYTPDNTLCLTAAQMYFGRLDAGIAARVKGEDAYPWVSLIIELRACWLYAIYQEALQEGGVQLSLKSLLAEEDMHLAEMYGMCGQNHAKLRELSSYETDLFAAFWNKLEGAVELAKAA